MKLFDKSAPKHAFLKTVVALGLTIIVVANTNTESAIFLVGVPILCIAAYYRTLERYRIWLARLRYWQGKLFHRVRPSGESQELLESEWKKKQEIDQLEALYAADSKED